MMIYSFNYNLRPTDISLFSDLHGGPYDRNFSEAIFKNWLDTVKKLCVAGGYWQIAGILIGQALFNAPLGTSGLWIHKAIAKELNAIPMVLRAGFNNAVFNSRGVYRLDPSGKQGEEIGGYYSNSERTRNLHSYWNMKSRTI